MGARWCGDRSRQALMDEAARADEVRRRACRAVVGAGARSPRSASARSDRRQRVSWPRRFADLLRQLLRDAGRRRASTRRTRTVGDRSFKDYCGDVAEDVSWEFAEAALAHSLEFARRGLSPPHRSRERRKVMRDYAAWLNGDSGVQVITFNDQLLQPA